MRIVFSGYSNYSPLGFGAKWAVLLAMASSFWTSPVVAETVSGSSNSVANPLDRTNAPVLVPPAVLTALAWDSESKEYSAKLGETNIPFSFLLTNISQTEVVISNVTSSCGCTIAKLPVQPWHIPPRTNGEIKVTMDLTGKMGRVTKDVTVNTSTGTKVLRVTVRIPPPPAALAENARGDRAANVESARADRQAIFKGDCVSCHVTKGIGKFGKELYVADCAICHDSPRRAAMVPDLRAPKTPRDNTYWANWITSGRDGSLMPAFGEKEGGPLSQAQIDSLVSYLIENFPKGPPGYHPPKTPVPPVAQ